MMNDSERSALFTRLVQMSMPHGVEVSVVLRGDRMDLRFSYEGATSSLINAFGIDRFPRYRLGDSALRKRAEDAASDLVTIAQRHARRLMAMHDHDVHSDRFDFAARCAAGGHQRSRGSLVCTVCRGMMTGSGFDAR